MKYVVQKVDLQILIDFQSNSRFIALIPF